MSDNSNDNNGDYEVGRGKPPLSTRFGQPGGNKRGNGRPKGSRNLKLSMTLMQSYAMREATKPVKVTDGDEIEYLPKIQLMFRQLYNLALKGNIPAIRLALDHTNKLTTQSDKDRHEFIYLYSNLMNRVSKSRANLGSLEHLTTLHSYFSFKRDIRRIEGNEEWIFEDDEPLTEKDWHYFENLREQLFKGDIVKVKWPPKYPSETEAEEWNKQKAKEIDPQMDLFGD